MGFFSQYRLLLWKNSLLLRRQKLRVAIEIFWPLTLFIILAAVRSRSSLQTNKPECHFESKPMPSAGLVPFVQGVICTSSNNCSQREATSEQTGRVSGFNDTLLERVIEDVAVILNNDTQRAIIVEAIQEISDLAEILDGGLQNGTDTSATGAGGLAVGLLRQFLVVNESAFAEQLRVANVTAPPPTVLDALFQRTRVNTTGLVQAILEGAGLSLPDGISPPTDLNGFTGGAGNALPSILAALIAANQAQGFTNIAPIAGLLPVDGTGAVSVPLLLALLQGAGGSVPGLPSGVGNILGNLGGLTGGLPGNLPNLPGNLPNLPGNLPSSGSIPGLGRKKRQTSVVNVANTTVPGTGVIDVLEGGEENGPLEEFCQLPENANSLVCWLRATNPNFGNIDATYLQSLVCNATNGTANGTNAGVNTPAGLGEQALRNILIFETPEDEEAVTNYVCSLSNNETVALVTTILEDVNVSTIVSPRDPGFNLTGFDINKVICTIGLVESVWALPSVQSLVEDLSQFQSVETAVCGSTTVSSDSTLLGGLGALFGSLGSSSNDSEAQDTDSTTLENLLTTTEESVPTSTTERPTTMPLENDTRTPEEKKLDRCQRLFTPDGLPKAARVALAQFYPIIFGKIPFSPDTPVTRDLMNKTSRLFRNIETVTNALAASSRAIRPLIRFAKELGPFLSNAADSLDATPSGPGSTSLTQQILRNALGSGGTGGGTLPGGAPANSPPAGNAAAGTAAAGTAAAGTAAAAAAALAGLGVGASPLSCPVPSSVLGLVPVLLGNGSAQDGAGGLLGNGSLSDTMREWAESLNGDNGTTITTLNLVQQALHTAADYLSCMETDKFYGVSNEAELVQESLELIAKGTYWAAIVFEGVQHANGTSMAAEEAFATSLPTHVKYKIRMNTDKVDGTDKVEDRTYHFGARSNALRDLKYVTFGFAYLQDLLERSVIESHTGDATPLGVYLQQFPFPCYVSDAFNQNIASSMPLFMVLAWLFSVAMIVKGVVREKQTRLKEVMKMMGLGNAVHWSAWFTTSYALAVASVVLLCVLMRFGNILVYADMSVVFVLLLVFAWATVCQAFLFSVFFSNANLAACCAALLYFILYLPYTLLVSWEDQISEGTKAGVSLFSSVAFGFACSYMSVYELTTEGVQWSNIWQSPVLDDTFSVGKCMVIMLGDGFLYLLLVWYIEAVFPGKYGVPKKFYFMFTRSYWCGHRAPPASDQDSTAPNGAYDLGVMGGEVAPSDTAEPDPVNLTCGVAVDRLRKVYKTGGLCAGQSEKVAVDGLSLNFYEDQITSFLGHNGAGKTTTMSVLSGLFPPTSGTARVYGLDIRQDMDEIRHSLGICPQFNVLFDTLTVEEHILFYAAIKGMGAKEARKEMDGMLKEVGLLHKKKEFSRNLSGGMKRKLSVMAAFVGGSRCVILDEPTAGVDPYSRRQIWELLLRFKRGRTVILSTHHMDEADFLGDRIAIISHGRLRCVGSSLFLKARYGSGYYLTVEMKGRRPDGSADGQEGKEEGLARGGTAAVAAAKDGLLTNSVESLLHLVNKFVPGSILESSSRSEACFLLPAKGAHNGSYVELFRALDARCEALDGAGAYGVSDTTLEEVFLRVADETGVDALASLTDGGSLARSSRARLMALSRRHLEKVKRHVRNGLRKSASGLSCVQGSEDGEELVDGGSGYRRMAQENLYTESPSASRERLTSTWEPSSGNLANSARAPAPAASTISANTLSDGDSHVYETVDDLANPDQDHFADAVGPADVTLADGKEEADGASAVSTDPMTGGERTGNRNRNANRYESDTEGETDTEGASTANDVFAAEAGLGKRGGGERVSGWRLYAQQFRAMFIKRFHNVCRSAKAFVCEILLPGGFVCFALSMALIVPPVANYPPLEVHPYYYEPMEPVEHLRTFYRNENPEGNFTHLFESLIRQGLYGTRCMDPSVYQIDGYPCLWNDVSVPPQYTDAPALVGNLTDCDCSSGFQHCPAGAAGPEPSQAHLPTGELLWDLTGRNISDYLRKRRVELRKRVYGGFSLDLARSLEFNESSILDVLDALPMLPGGPGEPFSAAEELASNSSEPITQEEIQAIADGLDVIVRSVNTAENLKVWFNNKGWLSSVAFLNGVNNVALRARLDGGRATTAERRRYGISLVNHPMERTDDQVLDAIRKRAYISVLISICIIFAMSLIPATFILYLIDDRVSTSKHLQFVSGLNRAAYWASNYAWDIVNYCLASVVIILLFVAFNEQAYVSPVNAPALMALLLFYGIAMIPLMYPFSFVFTVPSTAFVVLSCLNIFLGFTTTIATFILESFPGDAELEHIGQILQKVFLVFPHYCLGRGLIDIATRHVEKEIRNKYVEDGFDYNPFELGITGWNLICMMASGVFYFLVVLLIEYDVFARVFYSVGLWSSGDGSWKDEGEDEEDVQKERERIKRGDTNEDVLVIEDLVKVYRTAKGKRHTAVKKVCLGVRPGECFGLLGVNGAGKTTTFKMLTGDTRVTSGDARLRAYSILTHMPEVQRSLGYCPQFDALDGLLTAKELVEFYARLRGVPGAEVKEVASQCLLTLGLQQYVNKLAGDLSGGNKRKLQAAIALIGSPEMIFLDEPTTGMDPKARRFLWTCIRRLVRAGQSVVLTSHSMEECEALCTRLAIMVNGKFKCLGGPQHLKHKYGNGYSIKIRAGSDEGDAVARLKEGMRTMFRSQATAAGVDGEGQAEGEGRAVSQVVGSECAADAVVLTEENRSVLQYHAGVGVSLVDMFVNLETLRKDYGAVDYSVNQTNLDQVFINFASEQTDEVEGSGNSLFSSRKKKRGQTAPIVAYQNTSGNNAVSMGDAAVSEAANGAACSLAFKGTNFDETNAQPSSTDPVCISFSTLS